MEAMTSKKHDAERDLLRDAMTKITKAAANLVNGEGFSSTFREDHNRIPVWCLRLIQSDDTKRITLGNEIAQGLNWIREALNRAAISEVKPPLYELNDEQRTELKSLLADAADKFECPNCDYVATVGTHAHPCLASTGNTEEREPLVDPAVIEYAKRFADGLEPTSERPHEKFRKAINDALSSYHIQQQTAVDDRGFMLVDALTPAWESDITKGSMELDSLADHIFDALPLGDSNE